jgi:hypothetical protein
MMTSVKFAWQWLGVVALSCSVYEGTTLTGTAMDAGGAGAGIGSTAGAGPMSGSAGNGGAPVGNGGSGAGGIPQAAGGTSATGGTGAAGGASAAGGTSAAGGAAGSSGGFGTAGASGSGGVSASGGSAGQGASGGAGRSGAAGAGGTSAGRAGNGGTAGTGGTSAGAAGASGGSAGSSGRGGASGAGGTGGNAGAGGSASGAAGSGTVDAGMESGPSGVCTYPGPLTLLYRDIPGAGGLLTFAFKLMNDSTQPVALSEFKVRYFLTSEIASPSVVVAYGNVCCPDTNILTHVTATMVPVGPPLANADRYIEISFDASSGTLAPAHSVEVEMQFRDSAATNMPSNKTNDYSYIATAIGTQAQWDACPGGACTAFQSCLMTVYRNGTLVWGTPP